MSNAARLVVVGAFLLGWFAVANSMDSQTAQTSGMASSKDAKQRKQLVWIKPRFVKRHGHTKWIAGEYKWQIWIPPQEVIEHGHKKTIPGKYIYQPYHPPEKKHKE